MFRALCFAVLTAAAVLPAQADNQLATIHAGDTAQMAVGDTQAIAFYTTDRKGMQVMMVFTDAEGDVLRTRVRLDDGQEHSIILDGEDVDEASRFSFRRAGDTVEMTGAAVTEATTLAARY